MMGRARAEASGAAGDVQVLGLGVIRWLFTLRFISLSCSFKFCGCFSLMDAVSFTKSFVFFFFKQKAPITPATLLQWATPSLPPKLEACLPELWGELAL